MSLSGLCQTMKISNIPLSSSISGYLWWRGITTMIVTTQIHRALERREAHMPASMAFQDNIFLDFHSVEDILCAPDLQNFLSSAERIVPELLNQKHSRTVYIWSTWTNCQQQLVFSKWETFSFSATVNLGVSHSLWFPGLPRRQKRDSE